MPDKALRRYNTATCIFCGDDIEKLSQGIWLGIHKYVHRDCDACPKCGVKASDGRACDHRDWNELGR